MLRVLQGGTLKYANETVSAGESFFDGTRHTDKVIEQAGKDKFHNFPRLVENFEAAGTIVKKKNHDGSDYIQLEIPGQYSAGDLFSKTYDGVFEFGKDSSGNITHRLFRPNK